MTHLRPEDISTVHSRQLCRRGQHLYGRARQVGGGIVRQVCVVCGSVTIDVTAADEPLLEEEHQVGN